MAAVHLNACYNISYGVYIKILVVNAFPYFPFDVKGFYLRLLHAWIIYNDLVIALHKHEHVFSMISFTVEFIQDNYFCVAPGWCRCVRWVVSSLRRRLSGHLLSAARVEGVSRSWGWRRLLQLRSCKTRGQTRSHLPPGMVKVIWLAETTLATSKLTQAVCIVFTCSFVMHHWPR